MFQPYDNYFSSLPVSFQPLLLLMPWSCLLLFLFFWLSKIKWKEKRPTHFEWKKTFSLHSIIRGTYALEFLLRRMRDDDKRHCFIFRLCNANSSSFLLFGDHFYVGLLFDFVEVWNDGLIWKQSEFYYITLKRAMEKELSVSNAQYDVQLFFFYFQLWSIITLRLRSKTASTWQSFCNQAVLLFSWYQWPKTLDVNYLMKSNLHTQFWHSATCYIDAWHGVRERERSYCVKLKPCKLLVLATNGKLFDPYVCHG